MDRLIPSQHPDGGRAIARQRLKGLLIAAWCVVCMTGLLVLWKHANTPAGEWNPPSQWPAESSLPRTADRDTLVMFIHPRCPCTRAALRELERLMAQLPERVDVVTCFLQPAGVDAKWVHSATWQQAGEIEGINRVIDVAGLEAQRFQASHSAQVVHYSAGGSLAFHGGITAARSHEGESAGRLAITHLTHGDAAVDRCPSFGCPLWNR